MIKNLRFKSMIKNINFKINKSQNKLFLKRIFSREMSWGLNLIKIKGSSKIQEKIRKFKLTIKESCLTMIPQGVVWSLSTIPFLDGDYIF